MRGFGLVAVVAVAGCAAVVPPALTAAVPKEARLSAEVLTVGLSDGTLCRADWAAAGGAGRLEPCGPGFDYRVTVVERPNLLRQVWTELTSALGAEGAVPPMARVEIAGAGRTWAFASPPPAED